jgi:hypothetical protein
MGVSAAEGEITGRGGSGPFITHSPAAAAVRCNDGFGGTAVAR